MADVVDRATRSRMMAGITGKNTKPELIVRKYLHRRGFRFRLHDKRLPGRPDLVFPKYRAVVQVHGCFWHQHRGCDFAYMPKTRVRFWRAKLGGNSSRDKRNNAALRRRGWRVATIWECEIQNEKALANVARWITTAR
jgi:DNA mismatch endonuclease (patch repair protein)